MAGGHGGGVQRGEGLLVSGGKLLLPRLSVLHDWHTASSLSRNLCRVCAAPLCVCECVCVCGGGGGGGRRTCECLVDHTVNSLHI